MFIVIIGKIKSMAQRSAIKGVSFPTFFTTLFPRFTLHEASLKGKRTGQREILFVTPRLNRIPSELDGCGEWGVLSLILAGGQCQSR